MYQMLSVLQTITEGFVHRIGPEQLFKDLPPKSEHVVLLRLDPAQERMYKAYLEVRWYQHTQPHTPTNQKHFASLGPIKGVKRQHLGKVSGAKKGEATC